jgi:UPF0755 protein
MKQNKLIWRLLFIFILIFLGLIGFTAIYARSLLRPVDSENSQIVRFVIPKGQSVTAIASRLEEESIIKSSIALKTYYRLFQDKYVIQAGSYELSPSMTVQEILITLNDGADDIWITLPEGLRREEVAASLAEYQLSQFDQNQFLLQTVGLEGRLFPETYLVPREITTQALINLMTNTFEQKIQLIQNEIDSSDYSLEELLIIASLLEREARDYDQMRQVAGILFKRLEIGMPLQVDATIQYAKGYDEQNSSWWSTPTVADKQTDSRYNTYQNPGLPPTPICNPGFSALQAATNPQISDNLFYLHDGSGQIHVARTLDQHNQNIKNYLH